MLFKYLVVAALAGVSAAQKISAQKVVSNVDGITQMSREVDTTAKTVTLINGFQTGPDVIKGFHGIVKQATKDYHEMEGQSSKAKRFEGSISARALEEKRQSSTYTEKEQAAVCDSFITFVKVHQALLSTVIGKHGILEVTGVAYQMAAVLRGVEGVVDEIAFTLISYVPTCAAKAKAEKEKLDKSLAKAITTYAEGLP